MLEFTQFPADLPIMFMIGRVCQCQLEEHLRAKICVLCKFVQKCTPYITVHIAVRRPFNYATLG